MRRAATGAPAFDVTAHNLEEYLGPRQKLNPKWADAKPQIGVTTGMAWTPLGGEILFIETTKVPQRRRFSSHRTIGRCDERIGANRVTIFCAPRPEIGIAAKIANGKQNGDVHVHVPAGAIPKDGPSAGVAMTAALASLLSGRPARHDIAMTGEVTLTGRVLPVGGIKEKVLAARQAGINTIILPERNRADVKDIPEVTRNELKFEFVTDVREAVEHVLLPAKTRTPRKRTAVTTPMEQDTSRTDPPIS